jgi:chemotaxis signal transduction protein
VDAERNRETEDSRDNEATSKTSDIRSLVIFRLAERWYALPTAVVKEVAEVGTIRGIPRRSSTVLLGLINLRGSLYLCVSLDGLLGRSGEAVRPKVQGSAAAERLIVMEDDRGCWVFPADEVSGVFHFLPEEIQPIPAGLMEGEALSLKGIVSVRERTVHYLDEKVLFDILKECIS